MIDLRTVKCACGNTKCMVGISFDEDSEGKLILRFNDKTDREHSMILDRKTTNELISQLRNNRPKK